jgi:hypothetical protein
MPVSSASAAPHLAVRNDRGERAGCVRHELVHGRAVALHDDACLHEAREGRRFVGAALELLEIDIAEAHVDVRARHVTARVDVCESRHLSLREADREGIDFQHPRFERHVRRQLLHWRVSRLDRLGLVIDLGIRAHARDSPAGGRPGKCAAAV